LQHLTLLTKARKQKKKLGLKRASWMPLRWIDQRIGIKIEQERILVKFFEHKLRARPLCQQAGERRLSTSDWAFYGDITQVIL
jgi:hypothetical protein